MTVPSNDGLLDVSMCTELDGSLWIIGTVSDISSLGCLTSVGVLRIESTELVDLSGLSRLERAEDLEIEGASALTQVGLPALTQLDRLTLVGNEALEQLDLPALTQITWDVDVTDNASLSNCEVEALLEQVGGAGGNVCYQDNARNACLPLCR